MGPERTGQPGENGRHYEGSALDRGHVIAEIFRPILVLAHSHEARAEGRTDDAPRHDIGEGEDEEREIVGRQRLVPVEPEQAGDIARRLGQARQPVAPAGDRAAVEDRLEAELREGERQQDEIDPACANAEIADDERGNRAHRDAGHQRKRQRGRQMDQRPGAGIGAEPEEHRVAEGDETGVAGQQVIAEQRDPSDDDAGGEIEIIGVENAVRAERQQQQKQRHRELEAATAAGHDSRAHSLARSVPNRPAGLTSRTRATTT